MHEFFAVAKGSHYRFPIFTGFHIGLLAALGAIILSMIVFRRHLCQKSIFYRFLLVPLSLFLECSYLVWLIEAGKWHLWTSLPLELCEVTFLLGIIMLLGKSYKLFEVVYFWGFIGSSLALLFPNLHVSYHYFPFWVFMLTHSLNLITLTLMMLTEKYRPTWRSIGVSFIVTNIYLLFIATFNFSLGSNYFYYYVFKRPAPNLPDLFQYANTWSSKILILEGLILIGLFIGYLPFIITDGFKKKYSLQIIKRNPDANHLI